MEHLTPKELRIGNYVFADGRRQEDKGVCLVTGTSLQIVTCGFPKESRTFFAPVSPIPLNEEWLKKFGFEYDVHEYWYKTINRESVILTSTKEGFILCDTDVTTYVKTVHHLQNIIFALTGEELTIKEQ